MGYFLIWLPNGRPKSPAFHALPSDFCGNSQSNVSVQAKYPFPGRETLKSNLGKIFSDEEIS